MAELEVLLLGAVALRWHEAAVRLPAKLKALACYLVARGGAERDELAELFWGPGARHNLRVALHQLRRSLPSGAWPETAGTGERVALSAESDARRFELAIAERRWDDAASAWLLAAAGRSHREVFMAGFDLPRAVGFQEWLELERGRLGSAYLGAVWQLVRQAEMRADHEVARGWLRTLLQEDPLDERAHRHAMQLELDAGEPGAALDHYDLCRRVLLAELGVEPAPATRALAQRAQVASSGAGTSLALRPLVSRAVAAPEPGLVGRDEALERLEALLPTASPLSIVGPGGVGKSRLARAFAARLSAHGEAVLVVDLEPLPDSDAALFALAAALGLGGASRQSVLDGARQQLLGGERVVLLDGVEPRHAAGALLRSLLDDVPAGRCLLTSREPLGLAGEVSLGLRGLAVPAGAAWRDAPAARLFVRVARRNDATFVLTPRDRAPLRALVDAVDGLPLGLELAASLVPAFSVAALARVALERPDELGGEAAVGLPARHRDLDQVLATAFNELEHAAAQRLAVCSVFAGPFDVAAARDVVAASPAELARWTRASWITSVAEGRWNLHARVRRFLAARLDVPQVRAARARHAAHYLARLRDAAPQLRTAAGGRAMRAALAEWDEIRLAWSQSPADALGEAVEALRTLLDVRARHAEAVALLRDALARNPTSPAVAAALHTALAAFENRVGERERAERRARLASALALRAGDDDRRGAAQLQVAEVAYDRGAYERAEQVLRGLASWRPGDPVAAIARERLAGLIALGRSRAHRGADARRDGFVALIETARRSFESCLNRARRHGDAIAEAEALHDLGFCQYVLDDHETALATFQRAERLHRAAGAWRRRYIETYWIGVALLALGRFEQADAALRAALRAADAAAERPKALEVMQAFGLLWQRRGQSQQAAACHLAALATPGLDARVQESVRAWHLPPLREALGGVAWSRLVLSVQGIGYRQAVGALLAHGALPLPTSDLSASG